MLEYDNSAFYYFAITCSVLYLLPSIYFSGKRILYGCIFTDQMLDKHNVRCEKELVKIRQLQAEKTKLKNIFTWPFILNLILTAFVTYVLFQMVTLVQEFSEIKSFDPFEILNIPTGATDKDIKRAYRKMSLLLHPDKNPNDAVAEAKFMMVAKAYESLTDEAAKANYEKYGNPDGRQSMQLSIGLPTFLLDPNNFNIILFMYLLVLVIVIPSCVALWYSQSKKYGDSMILYDTYGFFNFALSEHAHLKLLPEILAGSAEFRELPLRSEDEKALGQLLAHMKRHNYIQKMKFNHPSIVKANLLLHAHVLRQGQEYLTPNLESDTKVILKHSMRLLDGMLEICQMKFWLQTTINIIDFGQLLTQGLWIKDSSLLQLPNFTDAEVKHCQSGKAQLRTLDAFIKADPAIRKGMNDFSDEEKDEIHRVCTILPKLNVRVVAEVDDEDFIAEEDIMTIKITLTRENVAKDETCDLVYAPQFPFPKAERWIAILGDARTNRIHCMEKITGQDRETTHSMIIRAPSSAGSYALDLFIKSDSYVGLDQKVSVPFTVQSAANLPVFEPHPEDVALDDDPTLFEQVMSGATGADSSDEESSDDEDSDDERADEEKKQQRAARLRQESSSSDSDDAPDDENKKDK